MSLNLCQIHLLYFFLSSVFISMHGFIQAFWLHVITLYSFFNTIPWFDAVFNTAQKMKFFIKGFFSKCDQISSFLRIWSHLMKRSLIKNFIFCAMKVLMSITYLLYKFPTNFLHFSIFILSGKMVNHCDFHVIFSDIQDQLQKIGYITIFATIVYKTFMKCRCILTHSKPSTRNLFWHCPSVQVTYIPMHRIWWFFFWIIIFHVSVFSFRIPVNIMTYSNFNTFFYY